MYILHSILRIYRTFYKSEVIIFPSQCLSFGINTRFIMLNMHLTYRGLSCL